MSAHHHNNSESIGYAGDVSVGEAWSKLESDPHALLIDVRTQAEWAFVGGPDLASLDKQVVHIEWQSFPTMVRNEAFGDELQAAVEAGHAGGDVHLFFLCRSGARSQGAARLATQIGFKNSFNVAGGFEGDLDSHGHRSSVNGWRQSGLPWRQS